MRYERIFRWGVLGLSCILGATSAAAQGSNPAKLDELVAVAHYYVVSYTVWPKNNEIRLCLSDDSKLKEKLRSVFSSRSSDSRRFRVANISSSSNPEQECDVVILSNDSEESLGLLERLRPYPILTVSSEVDLTSKGGMIYLPQGKPPRIFLERVTKSGLKVESGLLEISDIVK